MFNEEASTVMEGLGITSDHKQELSDIYFAEGSIGEVVNRIMQAPELSENERTFLLIEFGVRLVFMTVNDMAEAHVAEVNAPDPDEVVDADEETTGD